MAGCRTERVVRCEKGRGEEKDQNGKREGKRALGKMAPDMGEDVHSTLTESSIDSSF